MSKRDGINNSTYVAPHKRKAASSGSSGGHVPSHKQAVDHGHVYPARPYPAEYEVQTVKPQKGAARRAANKQIPDSARSAKKK